MSLSFLDLSPGQSGWGPHGVGSGSGSGDFSGWGSVSSSCPQKDWLPNSLWTIFSAFSSRRPSWEEKPGLTQEQLIWLIQSCRPGGSKLGERVAGLGSALWAPQGPPGPNARGTTFSNQQVPQVLGKCPSAKILTFRPWFLCHHLWEVFPDFPHHSLPIFPTPRPNLSLLPHSCCLLCVSLARF